MNITAKLLTIREDHFSNAATFVVLFRDEENYTWEKSYVYDVTDTITVEQLTARVKKDISKDLKPKARLKDVRNLVGKEFTFTV